MEGIDAKMERAWKVGISPKALKKKYFKSIRCWRAQHSKIGSKTPKVKKLLEFHILNIDYITNSNILSEKTLLHLKCLPAFLLKITFLPLILTHLPFSFQFDKLNGKPPPIDVTSLPLIIQESRQNIQGKMDKGDLLGGDRTKLIVFASWHLIYVDDMTPEKQSQQSLLSQQRSSVQEREDLVFELFQKTGMFGAYQKVSLVFWCVSCYICGGITLIIPFLLYQDPYDCPQPHPSMTCEEFVCSLPEEQRWQYIPAPIMSTMANKFGDYRCPIDSQQLDISVMIIYSSAIVAYVILTFFGDYLGRKRLMQIGLLLVLGGLAMTIFSVNLVMGSVGMMISCLGCEWIYTMSLLFISETVSNRYRDHFLVISQTFYGVGHLGNAAFYYFIRDWQFVFIYLYAIPTLLVLLALTIFVVDTPICLIDYLTPNKARKALFWVAKINGKKDFYVTLDQIKEVKMMEKARSGDQKQGSKFTLIDLFRYPSLRWMTIGSILIANTIFFLFYAPTLMIAQLDLDIFASGLIIGSSSLVAYPFCYFAITRVKRKVMALLSFGLVFVFSLVLVFIWHPQTDEIEVSNLQEAITMILFFLISFTITSEYIFFDIYVLELYPTQIRVIGTSFVQIIGSIGISFVNFIIDGCEDSGFSIMIVFCIVAALSVAIITKLPQTLDKIPPDFIREIAPHHSHLTHSKRESQTNGEIDEGK